MWHQLLFCLKLILWGMDRVRRQLLYLDFLLKVERLWVRIFGGQRVFNFVYFAQRTGASSASTCVPLAIVRDYFPFMKVLRFHPLTLFQKSVLHVFGPLSFNGVVHCGTMLRSSKFSFLWLYCAVFVGLLLNKIPFGLVRKQLLLCDTCKLLFLFDSCGSFWVFHLFAVKITFSLLKHLVQLLGLGNLKRVLRWILIL